MREKSIILSLVSLFLQFLQTCKTAILINYYRHGRAIAHHAVTGIKEVVGKSATKDINHDIVT
jgi:hypothetical protein